MLKASPTSRNMNKVLKIGTTRIYVMYVSVKLFLSNRNCDVMKCENSAVVSIDMMVEDSSSLLSFFSVGSYFNLKVRTVQVLLHVTQPVLQIWLPFLYGEFFVSLGRKEQTFVLISICITRKRFKNTYSNISNSLIMITM